jgi:GNAT superfamily N-acetyltransferase
VSRAASNWLELSDPRDVLAAVGTLRVRVAGWSMYPALLKGDELTVEAVSAAALRRGDLLVFRHATGRSAALVCHRLVAVEHTNGDRHLVTRGDATTGSGERIRADQVIGRVVDIRRAEWRGWPLAPALARRADRASAWVRERLARWLERAQRARLYRRVMRMLVARRVAVAVGVRDRSQRLRYERLVEAKDGIGGHREFCLTAHLGRAVVATLQATRNDDGCDIEQLYVRRRYRGLGIGRRLLDAAVRLAFAGGAVAVRVTIGPDEGEARCLLHASGFEETQPGLHAIYKEGPACTRSMR